MLDSKVKEQIAIQVIKVLHRRFKDFPENVSSNRNAPFHDAFLNAFQDKLAEKGISDISSFISLNSWVHGLSTTLGQSFFEKVAHCISGGKKREYTSGKLGNLYITPSQEQYIEQRMGVLGRGESPPNLAEEDKALMKFATGQRTQKALDFSADVFFEQQSGERIAIELKTVQPNSGGMRDEKRKILMGKAALRHKDDSKFSFYIGFPFDPTTTEQECDFDKSKFMASIINIKKFFDSKEVLVASELWDMLSGETGTMPQILEIIRDIATPDFMKIYEFLNCHRNKAKDDYKKHLERWHLVSEMELMDEWQALSEEQRKEKRLRKQFESQIFKDGLYKAEKRKALLESLKAFK